MSIYKKVLLIQQSMPTIEKDATNPHFKSKFASLASILSTVLPICRDQGVLLTNSSIDINGKPYLRISLVDVDDGDMITSDVPMIKIDDMQKVGQAFTYGARYGLLSLLGIAPDIDDDGNSTSIKEEVKPQDKLKSLTKDQSELRELYLLKKATVPAETQKEIELFIKSNQKDQFEPIKKYLQGL